jgi:hypothetical protein
MTLVPGVPRADPSNAGGYGRRGREHAREVPAMAEDAADVLRELAVEQAHVMGFSMVPLKTRLPTRSGWPRASSCAIAPPTGAA